MSDYWNNQTAGFTRGIGNIATAIAMQPRMRAVAAQRQAQMAEMAARTVLLNTQNDDLQGRMSGTQSLADEAQGAMTVDAQGRITFDPNKAPNLVSALIRSSKGGNDASMSIANFTKGQNAPVEADLTREENLTRALKVAQIGADERANRPLNVTDTLMSPQGDILGQAAKTVPSGDILSAPVPNEDLTAGIIPRTLASNPKAVSDGDYTQESVVHPHNPLYGVGDGLSTNVPPTLNITNTVRRFSHKGNPPQDASKFNSANEVKAAYKSGKLDKQAAAQILKSQFGMQ